VYAFDECYGLGADASTRYAEHIAAVSADDVVAAARRFLDPAFEVIALVAPAGAAPRAIADAAGAGGSAGQP
jgi:predicted Zn-dependent peptidase